MKYNTRLEFQGTNRYLAVKPLRNVLFQKISIPLSQKVLSWTCPPATPPEIPFHCHTFVNKNWAFEPPTPLHPYLEFLLTFLEVGMDIFWNYTMAIPWTEEAVTAGSEVTVMGRQGCILLFFSRGSTFFSL